MLNNEKASVIGQLRPLCRTRSKDCCPLCPFLLPQVLFFFQWVGAVDASTSTDDVQPGRVLGDAFMRPTGPSSVRASHPSGTCSVVWRATVWGR